MSLEPVAWEDYPSTATPLSATTLNAQQAYVKAQAEAASSARGAAEQAAANAEQAAASAAAPTDAAVSALLDDTGSSTHASAQALIAGADLSDGVVKAEDGRLFRVVAGVLRNTGTGWGLISDASHAAVNVDSVSDSTSAITVDYTSIGATKVVSFVVAPDETFAEQGFTTGASVGLTSSSIQIMQSRPFSDFVSWNGSAWVSLGGVFDLSFSAGVLACGHPKIPAGTNVNHCQVTGRADLPVHMVSGNSETNISIAWYNWSGEIQTTPSTNMRAFIAKGASGPLDPQQINTTLYPSSNLWFMGVFEVDD